MRTQQAILCCSSRMRRPEGVPSDGSNRYCNGKGYPLIPCECSLSFVPRYNRCFGSWQKRLVFFVFNVDIVLHDKRYTRRQLEDFRDHTKKSVGGVQRDPERNSVGAVIGPHRQSAHGSLGHTTLTGFDMHLDHFSDAPKCIGSLECMSDIME